MQLPPDLRDAIDRAVSGVPARDLTLAVEALIARYRAGEPATDSAILATPTDVIAYAAYRMPATYAAVTAALGQVRQAAPDLGARSLLDLGGGTGAAAWAVAQTFPDLHTVTVTDQVPDALELGERLSRLAAAAALRTSAWRRLALADAVLPGADIVTVSYVLGELDPPLRDAVTTMAAAAATELVVVIEPGTPAGYERVLRARDQIVEGGLTVIAPCPHQGPCPIVPGRDWCHFAARIARTSVHRQVKRAELSYEDEKFSFVAAVRAPRRPASGRVLRRPRYGKGMVTLTVCTRDDGIAQGTVSKRQGERYRSARDVAWGDAWAGSD